MLNAKHLKGALHFLLLPIDTRAYISEGVSQSHALTKKNFKLKIMRYLVLIIMLLSYMSLFGLVRNFNDIPKNILMQLDKIPNFFGLKCFIT